MRRACRWHCIFLISLDSLLLPSSMIFLDLIFSPCSHPREAHLRRLAPRAFVVHEGDLGRERRRNPKCASNSVAVLGYEVFHIYPARLADRTNCTDGAIFLKLTSNQLWFWEGINGRQHLFQKCLPSRAPDRARDGAAPSDQIPAIAVIAVTRSAH